MVESAMQIAFNRITLQNVVTERERVSGKDLTK